MTTAPDWSDLSRRLTAALGDDAWRNSSGTVYNVDFSSNSDHALDWFEAQAWSEAGQLGNLLVGWTTTQLSLNTSYYAADWPLTGNFFDQMREGVNYISLRVYDSSAPANISSRY